MRPVRQIFLAPIIFLFIGSLAAQDTLQPKVRLHSPRKALIFSAIFPGAGQIYNKQYWKAPVVWGGFVALGFSLDHNITFYTEFRKAYIDRTDGDSTTVDKYVLDFPEEEQLLRITKYFRRNLDLTLLGMTLLYLANLVDAYVDAHLFEFDVGDDLTVQWQPEFYNMQSRALNTGIHLTLRL